MITNADITVYNKVEFRDEITYYRTYIEQVNWQNVTRAVVGSNGIDADKGLFGSTVIFIPRSSIDECVKEYKKPKAFMSEADKSAFFTFEEGTVIVRGTCTYDLNAGTLKDLKAKYDDVLTVLVVDTADNGSYDMQHFMLEAK